MGGQQGYRAAVPTSNEGSARSFPTVRQTCEPTQAALRSESSPSEYGTLSAWVRTDAEGARSIVRYIYIYIYIYIYQLQAVDELRLLFDRMGGARISTRNSPNFGLAERALLAWAGAAVDSRPALSVRSGDIHRDAQNWARCAISARRCDAPERR
jgi:hypothetical protein